MVSGERNKRSSDTYMYVTSDVITPTYTMQNEIVYCTAGYSGHAMGLMCVYKDQRSIRHILKRLQRSIDSSRCPARTF